MAHSDVDYAGTREAKVFKDDTQIIAVINLRTAVESNDIDAIQRIINDPKAGIRDDPFVAQYMTDLLRGINLSVLQKKLKPYKRVALDFLASDLKVSKTEIINLLAELILEEKIQGQID